MNQDASAFSFLLASRKLSSELSELNSLPILTVCSDKKLLSFLFCHKYIHLASSKRVLDPLETRISTNFDLLSYSMQIPSFLSTMQNK